MSAPLISVLIPTFNRPEGLKRAARSVFAQRYDGPVELIVIDNSPEGSAQAAIVALAAEAPLPMRWAFEPRPGVAHARNAALARAGGELIAWLDDDQEAPARWLSAMMRVRDELKVDCVFGPVRAQAPAGARYAVHVEQRYSRFGPRISREIAPCGGVGNTLMQRATMLAGEAPFDRRADEKGGEDEALFAAAERAHRRFAWAAEAGVVEYIEPQRTTLAYMLRRAFASGQNESETAWTRRRPFTLTLRMSAGAAQSASYAIGAACALLLRRRGVIALMERAAHGAGKLWWFQPQRFYGAAAGLPSPSMARG